ncbi:MAG: 3-phosphoshikimate 1-carboxyvinyltransferase [Clostridia bacterium]|nr:3-phosphoshikimate 1-carboxyvinyltransferase [Clostridia bacterium]
MKVEIKPCRAEGVAPAPPSKSVAHRALICAALTSGSVVRNVDMSNDISATLSCLEALGAKVEIRGKDVYLGTLDPRKTPSCVLDCGESGSTLRFILPLCLISGSEITLRGTEKLLSRPLEEYEELCRERGFVFEKFSDGVKVSGKLTPGDYSVSMEKSSQFTTGLLTALSSLDGESRIHVTGKAESASYVDITLSVMSAFGKNVEKTDDGYLIKRESHFIPEDYTVEGDCSNAAFLEALNFVGGNVTVTGLSPETEQGDRVYPDLFEKIRRGKTADVSDCPDLAPILFALAAYQGGGKFTGTKRLVYKESDRSSAMKEELSAFGVTLDVSENSVTVNGILHRPDRVLMSHNDHRIAMSLAVLCTVTGGEIDQAEAVNKSYPGFFGDIAKLGIEVTSNDTR